MTLFLKAKLNKSDVQSNGQKQIWSDNAFYIQHFSVNWTKILKVK